MYQQKYLKYKTKYINLKNEIMGDSQKGHKKIKAERDEARKETSRHIAEVERKLGEKDKSYQAELKISIESYERELARANALDQELESKAPSKQVIDRIKQKDRDLLELRRGKTKRERLTKELNDLDSVLSESRSSKGKIESELTDVQNQLRRMTEDQRLENSKKQEIIEEMSTQVSSLGQNNTDLEQKVLELEGIINEKDRRRAKLLDAVGRLTNYLANNAQPKKVNSFW